jgi:excisionase family DNA binding protein
MLQRLLTVAEAAPLLSMSEQALYRAIRENQFPSIRIGNRIRIPESSVDNLIHSQCDSQKENTQETNTVLHAV